MFKNVTISLRITSYNVATIRYQSVSSRRLHGYIANQVLYFSDLTRVIVIFWKINNGWEARRSCRIASRTALRIRTLDDVEVLSRTVDAAPPHAQCWKVSINDILDKFRCFRFNCCSARCSMRYYPAQQRRACPNTSDFLPEGGKKREIAFPAEWTAAAMRLHMNHLPRGYISRERAGGSAIG